jgi:hypothetical protein
VRVSMMCMAEELPGGEDGEPSRGAG